MTTEPDDDDLSPEESHALLLDMVASITVHRDLIEDVLRMIGSMEPDGMSELRDQSRRIVRGLADGSLKADPNFPAERYWAERNAIMEAVMTGLGRPSPQSNVVSLDDYRPARTVH